MPTQREQVKPWFETGDFPTEAQFYQLFDWLRFKDELITIPEVEGLQDFINAFAAPIEKFITDGSNLNYTVHQDFLLHNIIIKPGANCTASCGVQGSGDPNDLVPAEDLTVVKGGVWGCLVYAPSANRIITVYGLPANSIVFFIKRKIA